MCVCVCVWLGRRRDVDLRRVQALLSRHGPSHRQKVLYLHGHRTQTSPAPHSTPHNYLLTYSVYPVVAALERDRHCGVDSFYNQHRRVERTSEVRIWCLFLSLLLFISFLFFECSFHLKFVISLSHYTSAHTQLTHLFPTPHPVATGTLSHPR